MATVFKSNKPCFVCRKAEKTVQAKLKDESNVPLCLDHMYERLEEKPKKEKAPPKPNAEKK